MGFADVKCGSLYCSSGLRLLLVGLLSGMKRYIKHLRAKTLTTVFALSAATLVCTLVSWLFSSAISIRSSPCSSIVVSLATFGVRIFNIRNTLLSLLSQTVVPDAIVVHLSLKSRTETISEQQVRSFLDRYFGVCVPSSRVQNGIQCDNGLLFVIGEDYGPATKVLGTLSLPFMDGDACIVSVDDDTIYDPDMVKTLTSRAPDMGALGFGCQEVHWGLKLFRGSFDPSAVWLQEISDEFGWRYPFQETVECNGWLFGFQGVVYRRKFFDLDVFNMTESMPIGCFYADDVRLSGYLWSKGIKRYVYPHFVHGGIWGINANRRLYHMEKNASNALSLVPNNIFDRQWPCVQYFNEFK